MATNNHITVEVSGLRELAYACREAEDKTVPAAIRLVNTRAAKLVAARAQELAPVGTAPHDKHPGNLRDNIKGSAGTLSAMIKAATPYAAVIHWGWAKRKIPRRAFLYNAADQLRDSITGQYAAAVMESIGLTGLEVIK